MNTVDQNSPSQPLTETPIVDIDANPINSEPATPIFTNSTDDPIPLNPWQRDIMARLHSHNKRTNKTRSFGGKSKWAKANGW